MSAVEVKFLPGRGRGLVTTRQVEAGEIVLAEEPLLLTVSQEAQDHACAHCMCWLERCPEAVKCHVCQQVAFCSLQCQQQAAAKPWVHAEATCRAYSQIPQLFPSDVEAQNSLRFLIQAAALKHSSSSSSSSSSAAGSQQQSGYGVLMSLAGAAGPSSLAQAALLQPALCKAAGDGSGCLLSVDEAAALLAKEQLNSYGLLAPLQHQAADGSSRALRGGGLYPACALINHECLPNVARFDALDAAVDGRWPAYWPGRPADTASSSSSSTITPPVPPLPLQGASGCVSGCSSTAVVIRTLHALPPGTELTQSYFPLNWGLQERQQQAQQVYGFTCSCPRCLLEASPEWQQQQQDDGSSSGEWETDEEAEAGSSDHHMEEAAHAAVTQQHQQLQQGSVADGSSSDAAGQQQQEPLEAAYLSVFMLKYVCPREGCCGTMAAVPGSDACECSVCGTLRTEAQFLAELEQ